MNKSLTIACILLLGGCQEEQKKRLDVERQLNYCVQQATKTLALAPDGKIPRNIAPGSQEWRFVTYKDWTSGFWPGILWYLYEYTGDAEWKTAADKFSRYLMPLSERPAHDHDLGFQVYNSFGNGYRLTGDPVYRQIILRTADTLASLYNPHVGAILSWPRSVPDLEWPQHNTIIDNMMNLELLFWASKNGGDEELYDIGLNHAITTMENQFRDDYTSYHVVVYNRETGDRIKSLTHQGYADETMWARGQAWAIYGFTMVYRETNDRRFLELAKKATDVYLSKLPEDLIPYWDFDAPNIPDEPRDASAAAIVASALIELSVYAEDSNKAEEYLKMAEAILVKLSSREYQSRHENTAFLKHSTGNWPKRSEVDASIIYADYYYLEALLRWKKIQDDEPVVNSKKVGLKNR